MKDYWTKIVTREEASEFIRSFVFGDYRPTIRDRFFEEPTPRTLWEVRCLMTGTEPDNPKTQMVWGVLIDPEKATRHMILNMLSAALIAFGRKVQRDSNPDYVPLSRRL